MLALGPLITALRVVFGCAVYGTLVTSSSALTDNSRVKR